MENAEPAGLNKNEYILKNADITNKKKSIIYLILKEKDYPQNPSSTQKRQMEENRLFIKNLGIFSYILFIGGILTSIFYYYHCKTSPKCIDERAFWTFAPLFCISIPLAALNPLIIFKLTLKKFLDISVKIKYTVFSLILFALMWMFYFSIAVFFVYIYKN